ncbi:MAG: IS4 family transposase, partial [Aestuariibacter sp.]|nr:IS4 family transposase [Aestuariibacter sp.]
MHRTATSMCHQQNRLQAYRENCDGYRYFNLLTSEALLEKVEGLLPEHRERLYPPTETLSMFLAQTVSADRCCQNIVNQAAVQRLVGGLNPGSTYTGGYCRARQRIPLEMVDGLTQHIGDLVDQQVSDQWCWQGRRVRIVDGTTVTMPDTAENQQAFPQQSVQKPGLGFPICRIVGITCLSSGVLKNAAIGPYQGKGSDEQTLLRSIQDSFKTGDIVLGDAFFSTYFFIAEMQAKGVDILMEQYGAR